MSLRISVLELTYPTPQLKFKILEFPPVKDRCTALQAFAF